MKYKITCEVCFPLWEVTTDISIPINKTVYYVCALLDAYIKENIDQNYEAKESSILVNKKTGLAYDKNKLVKESGLENGSKLVYF